MQAAFLGFASSPSETSRQSRLHPHPIGRQVGKPFPRRHRRHCQILRPAEFYGESESADRAALIEDLVQVVA